MGARFFEGSDPLSRKRGRLREGAGDIHAGLVGERRLVGERYMADPGLRAQYAEEIAPRTRAALARIWGDLGSRLGPVSRVLDLGAGTGAVGEAVHKRFGTDVEIVEIDQVATHPGVLTADLRRPGPVAGVGGRFELIVAAHLLNELGRFLDVDKRAALVFGWTRQWLADGGTVLLIEPALRACSRELLAVRDRLVSAGLFVAAPCLWQGNCPALINERDWCHTTAPWEAALLPERRGRSRVDFSYLALQAKGEPLGDRRVYRVVSDPMEEKGRMRLFGCGPAGRQALVRLDRERSGQNAGFDQVSRGDLLVVGETERAGDGLRIHAQSWAERREPE